MAHRNPNTRDRHFRSLTDEPTRREPRPQPRRQGTRSAVIRTALKEF